MYNIEHPENLLLAVFQSLKLIKSERSTAKGPGSFNKKPYRRI